MKKYIVLFLLLAVGMSSYGQDNNKKNRINLYEGLRVKLGGFVPQGFNPTDPFLPRRDTVIVRGEEIEVGAYLSERVIKDVEVVGFGKSQKSDLEKGSYIIKLKPKRTTTYEFKWTDNFGGRSRKVTSGRIVYVAKTAKEKKQLEEKLNAKLGSDQFTTYQYRAPKGQSKVQFTNLSR